MEGAGGILSVGGGRWVVAGRWVREGEKVSAGGSKVLGSRDEVLGQIIEVGIMSGILG